MSMKVCKAVFPAAGLGTRFLPATKAQPKEMLPLVDKPIIQYGVEEALAAGCNQIIMVTGRGKTAIEDHFDVSFELERILEEKGKTDLLKVVRQISDMIHVAYVRQKEALGLGHAVLTASSAEQALELAESERPDVVVLDVRLPGMDGLTALGRLRERLGPAPVIVITAYGDLQTAVEAVRRGAFEYLCKPFALEQMERALARAIESLRQDASQPLETAPPHGLAEESNPEELLRRIAVPLLAVLPHRPGGAEDGGVVDWWELTNGAERPT